jgi:hypothetical protein
LPQHHVVGDDQQIALTTGDVAPGPDEAHIYRVTASQQGQVKAHDVTLIKGWSPGESAMTTQDTAPCRRGRRSGWRAARRTARRAPSRRTCLPGMTGRSGATHGAQPSHGARRTRASTGERRLGDLCNSILDVCRAWREMRAGVERRTRRRPACGRSTVRRCSTRCRPARCCWHLRTPPNTRLLPIQIESADSVQILPS